MVVVIFFLNFSFKYANETIWTEVLKCFEPTDRMKMVTSRIYMFTESPWISNVYQRLSFDIWLWFFANGFASCVFRVRCHCDFSHSPCYQNIISINISTSSNLFDTIAFGVVNIQHPPVHSASYYIRNILHIFKFSPIQENLFFFFFWPFSSFVTFWVNYSILNCHDIQIKQNNWISSWNFRSICASKILLKLNRNYIIVIGIVVAIRQRSIYMKNVWILCRSFQFLHFLLHLKFQINNDSNFIVQKTSPGKNKKNKLNIEYSTD